MTLRRSLALTTGALLLTVPVLSSCGFDYATDRVNTLAAGVNHRGGEVEVLAAVIVAAQADSGTFIATLTNNSPSTAVTFDSLQGASGNTVTADDFDPIEIAPQGVVNLATDGGVKLNGTFSAGQFVPVSIGFEDGETVVLQVPVVTACHNYEGLDPSVPASPSASESTPAAVPTDGLTTEAVPTAPASSDAAAEEPSASPSLYSCDYAEIPENDPAVPGETE